MNGKERNLSDFRKLSAYIMQDNQLHSNLTVEEAMTVATSLKLSTMVPKNEKMLVVSSTPSLHQLQHCYNTLPSPCRSKRSSTPSAYKSTAAP